MMHEPEGGVLRQARQVQGKQQLQQQQGNVGAVMQGQGQPALSKPVAGLSPARQQQQQQQGWDRQQQQQQQEQQQKQGLHAAQ